MKYWLLKSEPDAFGIDDLMASPRKTTAWEGVRNYQARNIMRDSIQQNDSAFFYHSSCKTPGIAGIVDVSKGGYEDQSAPGWFLIDVKLSRKLSRVITLDELREHEKGRLADLVLLRRGNRLSVMPVSAEHWKFILSLE